MKNTQALLMTLVTCLLFMSTACTSTRGDAISSNRECRTFETAGSKMRRSICMSKEQWTAYDEEQGEKKDDGSVAEFFREQMNRGSTGATTVELD